MFKKGTKFIAALALCASAMPAMGAVVYSQNFEGALSGWTLNGYWHVTQNAPASGSSAFGFVHNETAGSQPNGSYAGTNGSQINAFSNAIHLTSSNTLTFDARVDDEFGDAPDDFDRFSLGISLDGVNFGTVVASSNPGNGGVNITENNGYHQYTVDLSSFANQTVYLAFGFATFDGADDDHPGPRIDNLSIQGTASTGVPEPASIALMGLGLAGLCACRAKKRS